MSRKDLDRLGVLQEVLNKGITQLEAARLLKISDRQVRTLVSRLRSQGPQGIVSRLVGRKGNRHTPVQLKERVLALLREKYESFGPTLASEKLLELERIKISRETIRGWMLEHHLHQVRRKRAKIHPTRPRRPCFGELIQADGSPDRWFGPDLPEVNATVLIDDATSMITGLYFSETETLDAYFSALEQHLKRYGRPLALYTDHSSIFAGVRKTRGAGKTQMQKAFDSLGIESILANSPQAKGRVERANRTLQDRLKKEMRLRGITTTEQANAFAEEYLKMHNERFSKKPMSAYDAHRSLEGYDLDRILCRKEERILNSFANFQFNGVVYQIQGISECRRLNKQKVEIRLTRQGQMRVFLAEKEVKVLPLSEIIESSNELSRKEILSWKPRYRYKPGPEHPWKGKPPRNQEVAV